MSIEMGYFLSTQILIPKITLLLGMMAQQTKVISRKELHHFLKTPGVQLKAIFSFILNVFMMNICFRLIDISRFRNLFVLAND
jgi:hypothetical protein